MAEIKKINRETPPIVKGKIANAITSAAKGHVVATTDDLYDIELAEYQDSINKRLDNSVSQMQGEVAGIRSDMSDVQDSVSQMQGEVAGIRSDMSDVQDSVSQMQGEVAGIHGDIAGINSAITEVNSEVAGIHGDIAGINSAITEVNSEVAGIHGDIAGINSAITEINYDLSKKIEKSIFDTLSSRTPTEKDRDFLYRDENDNILVVDKKNGGGSDVWVKITNVADYTSGGKYLFVREENNIAFNSASSPIDVDGNIISVVITDNKIAFDQTTDNASFIISDIDGGVSILSSGGYYIGRTQNSNGVESSQETVYVNTLSFDENGNVVITSSAGPKLQKNSSGNRFRYFKSAQHLIQLYKKVEISTPDEYRWKMLVSNDDINIDSITEEELDEILVPQCIPGNLIDC